VQQVFHKNLPATDAHQAYRHLEKDRAARVWVEVEMPESVFDVCADLARRFGPKLGVRTLDSLHVASAVQLKAERFWIFDERHAKLAKAAGLKVS
jgi:predicted nucleic acid-binding protein